MKFVAKEDIEAPVEHVFDAVSDFDTFQRQAIRRGATITRTDDLSGQGPGMTWDAAFDLRGRRREMKIVLAEYQPPERMVFDATSAGLHVNCTIELVALSRRRTRLRIDIDLRPQTLSARLLVQSLKLAKANLTKRLQLKVADYAQSLEEKSRKRA